jgi:hypothetical protein
MVTMVAIVVLPVVSTDTTFVVLSDITARIPVFVTQRWLEMDCVTIHQTWLIVITMGVIVAKARALDLNAV